LWCPQKKEQFVGSHEKGESTGNNKERGGGIWGKSPEGGLRKRKDPRKGKNQGRVTEEPPEKGGVG